MKNLSVCVYCGSRTGEIAAYADAARQVGREIGERGWQLVYGGGSTGLMGIVANAALAAGATVIGIIPASLMNRELGHQNLTELHVVDTMHQRKLMMAERSDAFLALPGGIGTFEELFEVWSWRHLGYHDKPLALLNVAGFYDPLLRFLDHSETQGFVSAGQRAQVEVSTDPKILLQRISDLSARATNPDVYTQI